MIFLLQFIHMQVSYPINAGLRLIAIYIGRNVASDA